MIQFKKINNLIDKNIKKKFYIIVLFNFFISIFEFLSVASIYPALLIITNISSNKTIDKMFEFLQIDSSSKSLNFFLILILSFIVLKNIFSVILSWYIQNYLLKNYSFISMITIKKMLNLNYLDVVNLTSPIFIRNSKEIVFSFRNYIMSLILISTEVVMVFSLFVLLLLISFKITLVTIAILSLFLFLLTKLSKNKITFLGKVRNDSYSKLNSSLIEIFNSFRELKIYSNINFYIQNFSRQNMNFAKSQRNIEFFSGITRNLFELIVVIFLAFAIYVSNFQIDINFLPTAGIFVFAFFRLYPSFTKISYLKTIINSNENSVDILLDIQNSKSEEQTNLKLNDSFQFKESIKIDNLTFGYDEKPIINNLSLTVKKGEIIGISGKNGSGKTTLCNIILSLIKPQKGIIVVDNKFDIQSVLKDFRNIVSFIPQNIFLLNDTIKNNITFNLDENLVDNKKLDDVIKVSGLEEINELINKRHNSLVGENGSNLSGGQRQRIAIARALFRNSQIIIMDEHTSSLDAATEEEILNDMKNLFDGKTIIIISHRKKVLDYCMTNYVLNDGKLKKIDFK